MSDGINNKIDSNSLEFKTELEKTIKFTDKAIQQFNWSYNPDKDITESIQNGLTRNKLIYGKRYCPCFFVTGNKEEDRICPCKPAIENEIPNDGICHCQIYCTHEYAASKQRDDSAEEIAHNHSRGLSEQEAKQLLTHPQMDSDEIEALLEARELKMVEFKLLDVREWMEHKSAHIKGTDYLVPTTSFFDAIAATNIDKSIPVIAYCHIGSRSAYCQRILEDMGYSTVGNLTHGIVSYHGELVK